MNESINNALLKVVEKELSAVLVGVAICLLYIFRVWDVPEKWDKINKQLRTISTRQRRIYQVLKILASQYKDSEKIIDFLEIPAEDEDNQIS